MCCDGVYVLIITVKCNTPGIAAIMIVLMTKKELGGTRAAITPGSDKNSFKPVLK